MTLHERVARALYEQQRGPGWDEAIELTRDVYLELASAALTATAGWLEALCRTRAVGQQLGAVSAIHGVAQLIRRALGLPAEEAPEATPQREESPGRRELREQLEGLL